MTQARQLTWRHRLDFARLSLAADQRHQMPAERRHFHLADSHKFHWGLCRIAGRSRSSTGFNWLRVAYGVKCEKTSRRVLRVDACAHIRRWPGIRKRASSYAAATFVPLDTHLPAAVLEQTTHRTVVDRDDDASLPLPHQARRAHDDPRGTVLDRLHAGHQRCCAYRNFNLLKIALAVISRNSDGTDQTPETKAAAYMRKKEGRDWFAREGPLVSG
jgi:hypothetical protein